MFTNESIERDRRRPAGEVRPTGPRVFKIDQSDDVARLDVYLRGVAAEAAQVQAAATTVGAEIERDRYRREDAFGELLRPGTLFSGTYVNARSGSAGRHRGH